MTRVLSAVAWPYTNGPRHIGHVAGFGVPSDVFSRFMRMAGGVSFSSLGYCFVVPKQAGKIGFRREGRHGMHAQMMATSHSTTLQ